MEPDDSVKSKRRTAVLVDDLQATAQCAHTFASAVDLYIAGTHGVELIAVLSTLRDLQDSLRGMQKWKDLG